MIEDILKIGKNELGRLQSVVIDVGLNGIIALVNKGDLVDLAEFNQLIVNSHCRDGEGELKELLCLCADLIHYSI